MPADAPVRDAARVMAREGIGSVLVTDAAGAPAGIVTDRDLRTRVLAEGREPGTPLREIMSSPLVTVERDALAFEALLEMTRRGVHHLGVVDGPRLVGVVSSTDVLRLQGTHPVILSSEIEHQGSMDGLKALVPKISELVAVLAREGASPYDIGRIVAELNDRIVQRVLALTHQALDQAGQPRPGVTYAWLALGSEGRREQTLATDQDNALVYGDAGDREASERSAAYFRALGRHAIATLVDLGFPPCPGGWMASNPEWCQPLRAWLGLFDRWIRFPDVNVLSASICFDLRAVAGDPALAAALWARINEPSADRRLFLSYLAKDCVQRRSALGLFGRLRRNGRGLVDIKRYGTFPLVGAARVHALEIGSNLTNTVDRFRALEDRTIFRSSRIEEITQAYLFVMRLRLEHQLEQRAEGVPPDNYIDPARLSRAERLLVKDAFRTIDTMRDEISDRYQTDLIA
jgi:CBS domain-containing protein